jgi:hypothetical protein
MGLGMVNPVADRTVADHGWSRSLANGILYDDFLDELILIPMCKIVRHSNHSIEQTEFYVRQPESRVNPSLQ